MNGYISLCAGDPCPPIFRSPVDGMEDIMDNQVICAIYRLPDAHKHITRLPSGVIFPKKSVTVGDLKPDPPLWHEDSGRRPLENGRRDPSGAISGWQLGEAAHRLVVNSLQPRADRNGFGDHMRGETLPYPTAYGQQHSSYQNSRYYRHEHGRMEPPRTGYAHTTQGRHHWLSNSFMPHNQLDHNYHRPQAPLVHQPYGGSRQYYQTGFQQNGGNRYPSNSHPRHGVQTPILPPAHIHQQGGYNAYGNHQPSGAPSYHNNGATWVPRAQVNPSGGRGYGRPQAGNQYSALDRGASRKPTAPGYSR
ncbi:hypothetical protein NMG60_11024433 [Bertholletia excelsa]